MTVFLAWPQNRWRRFLLIWPQNRWLGFSVLGLKISSCSLVIWASKAPRRFLGLDLKTKHASVCRLCLKTDERMRRRGHTSRSSGLLYVEVSWARVLQSDLKTGGGAMTGGARGTIVEIVSSPS
jgi:hypothetical protein